MHRISRVLSFVLVCVLGMICEPGLAGAAVDARAQFAVGVAAAAEGDHAAALAAFLAARNAGLEGPAVHYNIGVSAWTLGDLDLAESAFRETARHAAMAPLAHYNLGLVSRRRGDVGAARHWFTTALQGASGDSALQQLAANALAALPAPTPRRVPLAEPEAAFFLSAGAGHDDNVALLADGDLLGVSELASPYVELQAAVAAPLPAALSLQAGVFLVNYNDLAELDQRGAQVELLYGPRIGAWRLDLGGGYSLNQIDGERFEDRRSLLAGATRSLGKSWKLRLRLRYADVDGREPYAGLTGDRVDAAMRLRRAFGAHRLQAEYRLEMNDRAAKELSPDRHRIDLEWRHDLGRGLNTTLMLGWRHSRYQTVDSSWTERRTSVGAGLGGPIRGRWEWALRYDWADNSASLAEFEYDRNRFFAGVEAVF